MNHLPTVEAVFAATPVTIDGCLDKPLWRTAPAYRLIGPGQPNVEPEDAGWVRFAWNAAWFYMAVEFRDKDIVARGDADGLPHYQLGDLAELFLKPETNRWFWEMYVTPRSKQTCYWSPGHGIAHGIADFEIHPGLVVAAQCDGTVNDSGDIDTAWTAEMAVPVSELTSRGDKFGPSEPWRIFIGRYNYSRYLATGAEFELSSFPPVPKPSFHLEELWARLVLKT